MALSSRRFALGLISSFALALIDASATGPKLRALADMIDPLAIFRAEQVVADPFGRAPSDLAFAHASFASSASFHPSSASFPASSQAMFLERFLMVSPASSDSPSSCRPALDATARHELGPALAAFDPASFASFPASSASWPASVLASSARRWSGQASDPAAFGLAEPGAVAAELTVLAIAAPASWPVADDGDRWPQALAPTQRRQLPTTMW